MSGFLSALTILGFVGALAAVAIYFLALLRRPSAVRMLNGSGLFFTGAALLQASLLVRAAAPGSAWFNAVWLLAALLLAVVVQAVAALRNRRAWDGEERRSSDLISGEVARP